MDMGCRVGLHLLHQLPQLLPASNLCGDDHIVSIYVSILRHGIEILMNLVMRMKTVKSVKNHHRPYGDEKDEPLEGLGVIC